MVKGVQALKAAIGGRGRVLRVAWVVFPVLMLGGVSDLAGQSDPVPDPAPGPWTQDLAQARVTIEDLGSRFVDQATLQNGNSYRDVGAVLDRQGIVGLKVFRDPGNSHGGEIPLCIMMGTHRPGDPTSACMLLRIDGRNAPQAQVAGLPPERMLAVVVLRGREATRLVGSSGRAGAVLIYTRW
jgi:hypothetical protein